MRLSARVGLEPTTLQDTLIRIHLSAERVFDSSQLSYPAVLTASKTISINDFMS